MVEKDRKREDEWFLANEKRLLEAARLEREKREKERAAQDGGGGEQAAARPALHALPEVRPRDEGRGRSRA